MNAAIKCGVRRMFYPAQYVLDNQVMYIHEQHQVTNLLGPGTLFVLSFEGFVDFVFFFTLFYHLFLSLLFFFFLS